MPRTADHRRIGSRIACCTSVLCSGLVRRFYQSELHPSAYAAAVLRIVLVLLTLTVVRQMFAIQNSAGPSEIGGVPSQS